MLGIGEAIIMLFARMIELPSQGLMAITLAYYGGLGGLIAGMFWISGVAFLRSAMRKHPLDPYTIFVSGMTVSYVLLPFFHFVLVTPPYARYITTATNFFASTRIVQLACWGLAAIGALIGSRVTRTSGQIPRSFAGKIGAGLWLISCIGVLFLIFTVSRPLVVFARSPWLAIDLYPDHVH
jgi:hypothetical protein